LLPYFIFIKYGSFEKEMIMSCENAFYRKEETFYPKLYCRINDKYCIYSYKCTKVEKFLQTNNWEECYLYNMEKEKYSRRKLLYSLSKKGYLYVKIDSDKVEKIKNTIGEINQDYIYLRDGLDGYEISLTPFIKRTYNRKKTNE
jgi:hypothetical protein